LHEEFSVGFVEEPDFLGAGLEIVKPFPMDVAHALVWGEDFDNL